MQFTSISEDLIISRGYPEVSLSQEKMKAQTGGLEAHRVPTGYQSKSEIASRPIGYHAQV